MSFELACATFFYEIEFAIHEPFRNQTSQL